MKHIGKTGTYFLNGLMVEVKIVDARNIRWGYVDFLITPVAGAGQVWVEQGKVRTE